VHVFAPHFPYLPEPPYLHRFLPGDELRTYTDFAALAGYKYTAAKQPLIDKGRLRYDEWVAQADGAFGQFMEKLRSAGRLADTAVIVSSDHGESFQGGYLGHGSCEQLRPIVHVPLLVHLPGQTQRHDIAAAIDQTVLAPTILEIAGLERPDWIDGQSVLACMRGDTSTESRAAFTQYFLPNSSFKPITRGTIGVIDGRNQYIFDLDRASGTLFELAQAHERKNELSRAAPARAADLRAQITRRFPDIFGADHQGRAPRVSFRNSNSLKLDTVQEVVVTKGLSQPASSGTVNLSGRFQC
jgi:arylsulfatase A-like enzyme